MKAKQGVFVISPNTVSSLFNKKRIYMHNPKEQEAKTKNGTRKYTSGIKRFQNSYSASNGIKDKMNEALKSTYKNLISQVINSSLKPYKEKLLINEKRFVEYSVLNSSNNIIRSAENEDFATQKLTVLNAYNQALYGTSKGGTISMKSTDLGRVTSLKLILESLNAVKPGAKGNKDSEHYKYYFKDPTTGKKVSYTGPEALANIQKLLADAFMESRGGIQKELDYLKIKAKEEGLTKDEIKKLDRSSTELAKNYKSYDDTMKIFNKLFSKVFEESLKSNSEEIVAEAISNSYKKFTSTDKQKIGFAIESMAAKAISDNDLGGIVNLIGKDLSQRGDLSYVMKTSVTRDETDEFNFEVKSNVHSNFTKLINNDRGKSNSMSTNNSLGELLKTYRKFGANTKAQKGFSYAAYTLANVVNSGTVGDESWYNKSEPSILAIRGLWIIAFLLTAFEGTRVAVTSKQVTAERSKASLSKVNSVIRYDKNNKNITKVATDSNKVLVIMGNEVYYISDVIDGIINSLRDISKRTTGYRIGTGIAGLLTSNTSYYNSSWFTKQQHVIFGQEEYTQKQEWLDKNRERIVNSSANSNFYETTGTSVSGFKNAYKNVMDMQFKVLYGIKLTNLKMGGK